VPKKGGTALLSALKDRVPAPQYVMDSDVLAQKVAGQVRLGNWRESIETLLETMAATAEDCGAPTLHQHIERIVDHVFDIPNVNWAETSASGVLVLNHCRQCVKRTASE